MFEFNFYVFALIPFVILISYFYFILYPRLQKSPEYRQLSSQVPSVTKSLWSEIRFALVLAMKQPSDLIPFFTELFVSYGPVVHAYIAGRSYILLNDPVDIKVLLTGTQYINKGPEYKMLRPWLNEGLLLSSGSKWQNRRKLLTNTFHFKTLDAYNPSINKHSRVLVKKLLEAAVDHKEVSIAEYITLCSLDIICETVMGTTMNAQEGKSIEYVRSIKSACKSVIERNLKCWLWNDLLFRLSQSGRTFYKSIGVLHDYTDNVIKNKRMALNNVNNRNVQRLMIERGKTQTKSFLDLLLDFSDKHPDLMTDKDIREEVDTFLFEGHDTSSLAIASAMLLLGIHRSVQDKARDELFGIFGDSGRYATIEDLNAMKYLNAVIKETLRLYPSVPAITRELINTLRLENYTIPPMTTVAMFPYIIHRNEEIYSNPEEFIPERFLDETNKSKFLFGYLPFSAGARNCIGQKYAMYQMKTVLSTVLRSTKIETLGRKEDIKTSMQLILRIDSYPKMKFYQI